MSLPIDELLKDIQPEITFEAVRSRGPGGQNVNKVSSAAVLYWDFLGSNFIDFTQKQIINSKLASYLNREGLLMLRSDEYRDLLRNKSRCLEKLAELLEMAFYVPKTRKATQATYSSKLKKRQKKAQHSEVKKTRSKDWKRFDKE